MTIHKTTPEQQLLVAKYVLEMEASGLPAPFVAGVMRLAQEDQGVFDLLELWAEAESDTGERDQIVVELQDILDEVEDAPRVPLAKPKIEFDELEKISKNVMKFKAKLRDLIDRHGGVSEVARRAGIPQPSLSRLLSSPSMPRKTTLYRIARVLDVSESEVVTDWVR